MTTNPWLFLVLTAFWSFVISWFMASNHMESDLFYLMLLVLVLAAFFALVLGSYELLMYLTPAQ